MSEGVERAAYRVPLRSVKRSHKAQATESRLWAAWSVELRPRSTATEKQMEGVPMHVELMAITPNAEEVIEDACRTCYLSFHRKNPPSSTEELIKKILARGHHSVLEHASATFRVKGASRVFTHEMVRHRFVSPSQQSQRYVNECNATIIIPPSVNWGPPDASNIFLTAVEEARHAYRVLVQMGIPKEDARYILPGGTESEIVLTANFREWRHVFTLRCSLRAHWEIRRVCNEMLRILKSEAPFSFYDLIPCEE